MCLSFAFHIYTGTYSSEIALEIWLATDLQAVPFPTWVPVPMTLIANALPDVLLRAVFEQDGHNIRHLVRWWVASDAAEHRPLHPRQGPTSPACSS